jgi:hypothetical protein
MIITRYEDGYSLQNFEKQAPDGSDVLCLFSPDGALLLYFEPELSSMYDWSRTQKYIDKAISFHKVIEKMKGELE